MSPPSEHWQPVLAGADAEQAARFVERTVAALVATAPSDLDSEPVREPFLANGSSGKALLCLEASSAGLAPGAEDVAAAYVRHSVAAVRARPCPLGLYSGSTGLLWLLARWPSPDGLDNGVERTADLMAGWLRSAGSRDAPYDLISGVAGLAVAGAALARTGRGTELAAAATSWLVAAQEPDVPGSWLTNPDHARHVENPSGAPLENFGVAHGVPGVLASLATAVEAGVGDPAAVGAVRCGLERLVGMTTQRSPGDSVYPYWSVGEQPIGKRSRAAWCYGDPGVAAVLYRCASQGPGPVRSDQAAILQAVAADALQRSPVAAEVSTPGICHGAAGLAHIANRMFQSTGDDAFRQTAIRWFRLALAQVEPDGRRSGALAPDHPASGYLTGTVGIALVFTALFGSARPWWDEVLLL